MGRRQSVLLSLTRMARPRHVHIAGIGGIILCIGGVSFARRVKMGKVCG